MCTARAVSVGESCVLSRSHASAALIRYNTPPYSPIRPPARAATHCLRADTSPFVPGCSCWACSRHTRAYVHHLLHTHEMLAGVLLELHNTTWWLSFFDAIRVSACAPDCAAHVFHVCLQRRRCVAMRPPCTPPPATRYIATCCMHAVNGFPVPCLALLCRAPSNKGAFKSIVTGSVVGALLRARAGNKGRSGRLSAARAALSIKF